MNVSDIAKKNFAAAVAEAEKEGCDAESMARYMLSEIVSLYLRKRTVKDVQSELMFLAENCDPDTDYVFMRP